MRRHQLRRFDLYTMNRPRTRLRSVAAEINVVFPALIRLRVRRVGKHALRVLFPLGQCSFGRTRRFYCFSRDRVNVITPSNERHVSSSCVEIKSSSEESQK